MKVIRSNSKANFDDLKVGDKYVGHLSGKLCTKSDESHGIRLSDGARGFVPAGTIVGVPVKRGRVVLFKDVKPGQACIRQNVSDAESFVILKRDNYSGTRLGNGAAVAVSPYQQVEAVEGTYSFHGKA